MKKNKKKFVSIVMSKMILTSASALAFTPPKVVLNVNNAGMGQ